MQVCRQWPQSTAACHEDLSALPRSYDYLSRGSPLRSLRFGECQINAENGASVSVMTATQSLIQNAFQAAMLEFKTNLNNDELYAKLLAVASIDEVYDLTDKLQADQGRKGHLRHLAKIEPYLNRLREYTSAIDTFVQVYPEIMGLIWGPIKLLLQWSSVLTQSFDAIVNTTADIGLLLPEFQEVAVLFSQNTGIYDVLVLFFKDILDFYQIGLKFFTMPRTYGRHVSWKVDVCC